MQNKRINTEKNIEKLLNVSFSNEYQLDKQLKDSTLQILEQKVAQHSKVSQPENKIVVGLSVIWLVFTILIFSESGISKFISDLIKSAVGLSLLLIPVSSIFLIILKWRVYAKRKV